MQSVGNWSREPEILFSYFIPPSQTLSSLAIQSLWENLTLCDRTMLQNALLMAPELILLTQSFYHQIKSRNIAKCFPLNRSFQHLPQQWKVSWSLQTHASSTHANAHILPIPKPIHSRALSLTPRRARHRFPFLKILQDLPTDLSDPTSLLPSPACCCFRPASETGDWVSDMCSDLLSAACDRLAPQLSLTSETFYAQAHQREWSWS